MNSDLWSDYDCVENNSGSSSKCDDVFGKSNQLSNRSTSNDTSENSSVAIYKLEYGHLYNNLIGSMREVATFLESKYYRLPGSPTYAEIIKKIGNQYPSCLHAQLGLSLVDSFEKINFIITSDPVITRSFYKSMR